MTGFGSFDNSTCKRVLDLLKPGDLKVGQVVIKSVAVVELGVNNGSGDGGSCFGIEVWTDTAKTWRPKEASMPQTKSISAYSFRRNTDLWQRHSKTERQTYRAI